MSEVTLYHGSSKIISAPISGGSSFFNDLGAAFYCSEEFEIAGRMAVRRGVSGYINKYIFNRGGMNVLDFKAEEYGLLSWLDAVMESRKFRIFNPNFVRIKNYLDLNFRPNLPGSDVAVCPMCCDSYLTVTCSFLNNEISYDAYKDLMLTGGAEQYVLLSPKAVESLVFESSVPADNAVYFPHRKSSDAELREKLIKAKENPGDGIRIMDIVREKIGAANEHVQ